MSEKKPTEERILDYLKMKGAGTVDEIAAAVEIGRTSARKYLAGLKADKKVVREPAGRVGGRKLPDVFSLPGEKGSAKPAKRTAGGSKNGRLGPGKLDKFVLDYMRKNSEGSPHTAGAISRAIERSSGAVANCLGRLEKRNEVRLVNSKPREYELKNP